MTAAPPDIEHDEIAIEAGPGQRLSDARRTAKLSILEVAAQLHLDAATIEALERDDYAKLPAPAFVRGYLRSYARLVNLEAGPVIDAYSSRGFEPPALVADISSGTQAHSESTDLPWRLMTYLIAGIVVTLVVLWWRSNMGDPFSVLDEVVGISERTPTGTPSTADTSLVYQPPPEPAPAVDGAAAAGTAGEVSGGTSVVESGNAAPTTTATAPSFQSVVVPAAAPVAGATPAKNVASTVAAADPQPVARAESATDIARSTAAVAALEGSSVAAVAPTVTGTPVAQPAPAVSATTPSPAVAEGTAPGDLQLSFTHDSWVEVYDAGDTRMFFGMARAGREVKLRGSPPLRVLLGYARDIRVEYNGALLDYTAYVNRGIARFIVTADGIRGEPGVAPQ